MEGCYRQGADGGRRERRKCKDGLFLNTHTVYALKKNSIYDNKSACLGPFSSTERNGKTNLEEREMRRRGGRGWRLLLCQDRDGQIDWTDRGMSGQID